MMMPSRTCIVIALVGLQVRAIQGFALFGPAGVVRKASVLQGCHIEVSSAGRRPFRLTATSTKMLAMENESQRALVMMENDARMYALNAEEERGTLTLKRLGGNGVGRTLLIITALIRTIVGIFWDMLVAVGPSTKSLVKGMFNSERLAIYKRKALAFYTPISETVYDVVEEIMYRLAFLSKFMIALVAAITMRVDEEKKMLIDSMWVETEEYSMKSRKGRRPPFTGL